MRRILLCLLPTVLLFAVSQSEAQQPKKAPTIGYLALRSGHSDRERAFQQGLKELGYLEGQTITIEWRFAEANVDRLPALAAELIDLKVDALVAAGTIGVHAARSKTKTIPIVMTGAGDPVGSGFVASLARPGGNITGLSFIAPELTGKRLELLKEVVPRISRVAFLVRRTDPSHRLFVKEAQDASEKLRMEIQPLVIEGPDEIDGAFSAMIKERAEALLVSPLFAGSLGQGRQIADLAARNRLPSVSDGPEFVNAGVLISYGADRLASFRRAAYYVDKILKGARPADLPVEQPNKFELVINLKTAKQLGITIPQSVLYRADKVFK